MKDDDDDEDEEILKTKRNETKPGMIQLIDMAASRWKFTRDLDDYLLTE